MSTAKRSRRRPSDAASASPLPGAKRLKTTSTSHVPTKSGLGFLLDENARAGKKLDAVLTKPLPKSKTTRVDESHAVVALDEVDDEEETRMNGKPHDVVSISSAEMESEDEDMEDEDTENDDVDGEQPDVNPGRVGEWSGGGATNGHVGDEDEDEEREVARLGTKQYPPEEDTAEADEDTAKTAEVPSFAEMLRGRHPEPIDVQTALHGSEMEQTALIPSAGARGLGLPSLTTLSTALTQALKTNDKERLEKCLSIADLPSIRASIQRLQPHNAVTLLQRLSERIHRRPGRTGNLMAWVQWTLVTHGGYFSTQPKIMKGLRSLAQVVRMRASGLQPLLHLKGKLDLLSAQLELRRNIYAASRAAHEEDQDDEEAVLYVDGQDGGWSDDEDDGEQILGTVGKPLEYRISKSKASPVSDVDASDNEQKQAGIPNGFIDSSDDEGDENDDDENQEALFDEEAEETSNDEDEDPSSDDEMDGESESEEDSDKSDDDESEDDVKQPHPKILNRKR